LHREIYGHKIKRSGGKNSKSSGRTKGRSDNRFVISIISEIYDKKEPGLIVVEIC
jgi:hypothetical protein